MRFVPPFAIEESPEEELTGASVQPVEVPSRHAHRHHARRLLDHLFHAQAVEERPSQWLSEAEEKNELQGDDVEGGPERGIQRIGHELVPRRDLMEPSKENAEVGRQVNEVPGFI